MRVVYPIHDFDQCTSLESP